MRLIFILFTLFIATVQADSFTIEQNGRTYTCTEKEEQANSCIGKPATYECDDWVEVGRTREYNNDIHVCGFSFNRYAGIIIKERTCRTFDGCGNFSGTYTEKDKQLEGRCYSSKE